VKRRLWEILEPGQPGDRLSHLFDGVLLTLIALNAIAVVVGSMPAVDMRYGTALGAFEGVSVAAFTLEYLARVWSCTADPRYASPFWGRLRYARSPMAIVDLLAVLPFYLVFVSADLRAIRTLRLLRILRIAKLGRYFHALRLFGRVAHDKREELLVTLFVLVILLVMASSVMYYAEHEAQPGAFASIPATMWWAVETLTTVGYGDIVPITPLGRMLGAVVAFLGIGLFALPTAIIGAAFIDELGRGKAAVDGVCPCCGRPMADASDESA
jgi:voltage-gated potassium channel